MLGDDEHPISFLLEPRLEGAHIKVVVRAGLRGIRAFSGELTFRPEEWIAFREVLCRSTHDERLAAMLRASIPDDVLATRHHDLHSWATEAVINGQMKLVHLDLNPIEIEED